MPRWLLLVWPAAVAVSIVLQWPWLNLQDDIRFTFGSIRTPDVGPLEAFAHRPMGNRLVMAGLDALTGGLLPLREKLIVAWAIVFAGVAGAILHRGLLRWMNTVTATAVALAVFGSLAWASEPYVLQPEWTATVLAVAAFGLVLLAPVGRARSGWPWLVSAMVLLAVAVLQKYTTVTVVGLVVVALWALDRGRAVLVAVGSAVVSAVLFALTVVVGTHEWQWFLETPRLNPSVGLRWDAFGQWAVNVWWNNPILLAWPAAAALAMMLTRRPAWVIGSVVGFVGVLAVIVVQNQFFSYHATSLLPVAAGVTAYAAVRWIQRTGSVLLGLAPLILWVAVCRVTLEEPAAVRGALGTPVALLMVALVGIVALVTWIQRSRALRTNAPCGRYPRCAYGMAAALLALAITFPGWPATPYGLFGLDRSRRSEVVRQADLMAEAGGVRAVIGDAPVVYLADGETVYFIDSRTDCRYPSAVVLYRSSDPLVGKLRSFEENLACLRSPVPRFLLLQVWRVPFDDVDPRIQQAVGEVYDCGRAATRVREVLVCPRR